MFLDMRGAKLAIDPLWDCLCPSWNASSAGAALRFNLHTPTRGLRSVRKPQVHPAPRRARSSQHRQLSTTPVQRAFGRAFETSFRRPLETVQPFGHRPAPSESINAIYEALEQHAIKGEPDACRERVQELVRERGEAPNKRMYDALILANTSPNRGAAWRVHNLLQELQDEGIELDQGTCHNVLKVLAVHPDNLLRTDVQRYMRERWLALTPEGRHDITVGLLREGAFEIALNNLDAMGREGVAVEPWLLNMFAYMLSDAGEMELVYRMVRSRWESNDRHMSSILWAWLLDMASAARYHPLTEFVWRTQVELGFIQASSGICLNILSTASRVGDATLATDVFTYIAKRGEKNTPLHYQLLIDAYMARPTPDVERALTVLSVMLMEKLQPTRWHTRSLYMHLRSSKELPQEAFEILQRLRANGRVIPVAAVNLIIECYGDQENVEEALKVYKQMHTFSQNASRPFANTETFNLLLKACREDTTSPGQQAEFVLSEMLALRVPPDALTYDRLILVFTRAAVQAEERAEQSHDEQQESERQLMLHHLDMAYQYFNEIQLLKWVPRWTTVRILAKCLARAGDGRCWDLLDFADDNAVEGDGWEVKSPSTRRAVGKLWDRVKRNFMKQLEEREERESEESDAAT